MGTKFRDQISQKGDFPQPILFIFFLISFLFSTSSSIADMMVCMFYESYYNINSIISNSFTCWNTFTNLFNLYLKEWIQVNNTRSLVTVKCVLIPTLPARAWPLQQPTGITGLCLSASVHSDVAFWSFDVGSSYHCEAEFTKC